MKKISTITPVILLTLLLIACRHKETGETVVSTHNTEETHAHTEEEVISFTREQIKSAGIETGLIENKALTNAIRVSGVLRVPNQNKALINTLNDGILHSLLIQPGNIVKKGQVVATIANPEFIRLQEEYISIAPKIVQARQELNRQQILNEGNAGALKNLQAAASALQVLTAKKAALEQQIRLKGIAPSSLSSGKLVSVLPLRAPIGGVVSNVYVKLGSYVDLSTPVAEIIDNSQLHLDLFVYEKDLPTIKNNQLIHFTLTNNPGREYDAEIFSLGSSFEGESKAVSVHARIKGDKTGLIDGMNITALISLDKVAAPAVPENAIVNYHGQDFIFLVTDQGGDTTYRKIPVVKGISEVGYTQISLLEPVPANARIVTRGAFFVLAKIINSGEEGHEH